MLFDGERRRKLESLTGNRKRKKWIEETTRGVREKWVSSLVLTGHITFGKKEWVFFPIIEK